MQYEAYCIRGLQTRKEASMIKAGPLVHANIFMNLLYCNIICIPQKTFLQYNIM